MITGETTVKEIEAILVRDKLTIEGACAVPGVSFALLVDGEGFTYKARGNTLAEAFSAAFAKYQSAACRYELRMWDENEPEASAASIVVPLEGFIADNEALSSEEVEAIRALLIGQKHTGGGGAEVSWSVTRTR